MTYRVGIDSGSKTIKVVVLDEDDSIVHSVYLRHESNIKDKLYECLHNIEWQIGEIEAKFAFTGSSGGENFREQRGLEANKQHANKEFPANTTQHLTLDNESYNYTGHRAQGNHKGNN